jgi:ParB-like chromosome segregation protein Spo0J
VTEQVTVVRTELVPIDSVTPHPNNPRRGDVARIERSLRAHGQYQDIVVHQETGQILVGNHRWRVAKDKLGWTHISAKFVSCSDAKAREILAMDNRSSDDGRYDDHELRALLEMIEADGDILAAGYDTEDLDDLLARLEENDTPAFDPRENLRGIDSRKASGEYDAATVKTLILTYPLDEYQDVVLGLQRMCERFEVQDFAGAIAQMIQELDD